MLRLHYHLSYILLSMAGLCGTFMWAWYYQNLMFLWWVIGFLLMLLVATAYRYATAKRSGLHEMGFLVVLMLATLIPRIWWIASAATIPMADFAVYQDYAEQIAHGNPMAYDPVLPVFPFKFIYPMMIGMLYSITQVSAYVAQLVNVVMSAIIAYQTYQLGRRAGGEKVGQLAGLLFAFWPSQIAFCSVVAQENIFQVFFMATIILLLRLHETGSLRPVIRYSLFAGITLGLAHVLRPVAMVIIPTIVLYLKWCTNWFNLHKSRLVSFTLSFIVGLLITIRAIMGLASDVVNLPLSSTSAGFSLYEGTTINSRGCWSEEHGRILEDFAYRPDDIHKASYQRAWSNVSTDPLGFIQLIGTKFVLFWGSDDYGVFFSTTEQSPTESSMIIHMYRYHLNLLSNGAYIFLIVLAAIGLYLHRTTENKTLFIVQSVFLLHVAAYSILEIQSRYHFLVVPLLMIPAAMALASSKNNDLPV